MASKENPIRKVFDGKPMIRPLPGANKKLGRCVVEKSEKVAQIDLKLAFTIMAEQIAYIFGSFVAIIKSGLAWFTSASIYLQNMHIYHVYEDDRYLENL